MSWLGYAFRLMYLPIGLFGVSIATAALPDLSRHAHDGDATAIRRGVSSAIRLMLMLNVPAMIGLIVLAEPIVALLYQRGKFTQADTLATAAALRFYAPGLIGYSIVKIASPTFYSLGNSRTPVIVSVTSVTVNLVLNILLFRVMGFRGLALGTAIAALFNATALLWLLRARLGGIEGRRVTMAFLKISGAALVMGIAAALAAARLDDAAARIGRSDARPARRDRNRRRHCRPRCLGTPAADPGIHRRDRACSPPRASRPPLIAAVASRLRLHPTVLFVASVHFVVDGYGNIFAPLLPLLIPRLGLVARRGRDPDDAVPAVGLGLTDRVRPPGRSLAAAAAADGRARSWRSSSSASSAPRRRSRWPRRS